MLNGVDPIIIFNFKKNFLDPTASSNNFAKSEPESSVPLPAVPIYLSEKLSGVYIQNEDKTIDIDTSTTPTFDASGEKTDQRVINSSVKINMVAKQDSIGVSLFSAMSDLIIPRITSKEYSITYLHGSVLIFAGLLRSLSIIQQDNTDLYNISLELVKPASSKQGQPIVPNDPQASSLSGAAAAVKR